MSVQEIAKRYVALVKDAKFEQCLDELFAENAVSIEAIAMPGSDRVASGLTAIRAKSEAWGRDHKIHSLEVSGPYPNGERFAVHFRMDITNTPSGRRMQMAEVGLFTVENGKITREEFFYGV